MKKIYIHTLLVSAFLALCTPLLAQSAVQTAIQTYLEENADSLGLSPKDVSSWYITDNIYKERTGIRNVYIVQTRNGIPIENGVANIVLNRNNEVLYLGNRLIANLDDLIEATQAPISPTSAVAIAAEHVEMPGRWGEEIAQNKRNTYAFGKGTLAKEDITVHLAYYKKDEGIALVWVVSLYQLDGQHWWQVFVNSSTGEIIHKLDWVVSCNFNHDDGEKHHVPNRPVPSNFSSPSNIAASTAMASVGLGDYNVFALPVESPLHGSRSLVSSPADSMSSPYGWHDTNAVAGPDFTITKGNNVFAYTDVSNNNLPDFFPNGGPTLNFNFPLNIGLAPSTYQAAAVTNLFYVCNRVHDIFYHYGFDESNGNFQSNNYGNTGLANDYVYAEAQDGGGTNNANFATPRDGFNPRMQMFLWGAAAGSGSGNLVTVNSPTSIAGPYLALESTFGPALTATAITANLAVVSDGTINAAQGCAPLTNSASLLGKIAVVRRGGCPFVTKVQNAQNAGAVAVIIVNNTNQAILSPGGTAPLITIPSVMISLADGNTLIDSINANVTVNATLRADTTATSNLKDGDFDNGIIIHEYGHGISNRMTGGPLNSNCLSNDEQMGEGWSDFFAVMLTMDTALANPVRRGVGNFATSASINGIGIRNAPYDTSFAINPFTYGDVNNTNNISQPHGIGFVWATMLWDLNWAFINQYGFDTNIDSGSGGNNMVMQLVLDGLTLQPCSPGFVDGRDAILLADQINNNGANLCLIWSVFARRGLGFSANQGSSTSRNDQVEAFDIPTFCQTPIKAPVANFTSDLTLTCRGTVRFTDLSVDVPQAWFWDFGDGSSDSIQNPTHTYATSGTYNVSLAVYNTLGGDTIIKNSLITINLPSLPSSVTNGSGCSADSIVLTASGNGTIGWFNATDSLLATGNSFKTAPSLNGATFFVKNGTVFPQSKVGPQNSSFGTGGYHNTAFTGTVNFEAQKPVTIHSAWVDAGSTGPRTISLWRGPNASGLALETKIINIPFTGPGRINLDFEVPEAGTYSIGLSQADLYRNNSGAVYPYAIAGLISLTGSPAGANDFYYYFYDLEVSEAPCWSDSVAVVATITDTADFSFSSNNLTVTFTDLSPNATNWAWNFGDGTSSSFQNPTHTYAAPGLYNVLLSINSGSCVVNYPVSVSTNININEAIAGGLGLKLYPNPVKDVLQIEFSRPLGYATNGRIYALNGTMVKAFEINGESEITTVLLEGIAKSLYMVELDLDSGIYRQKINVRK